MTYKFINKLYLDCLGLEEEFEPDLSYYSKTSSIPLGTWNYFDSYDLDTMSDNDFYFYDIDEDRVFNWCMISRAGTQKTAIIKRIMTYMSYKNYKICGFDAKGASLAASKYLGSNNRLHPKEKPTSISAQGYLPSFAASQNYGASSLSPKVVCNFDNHFTLDMHSLSTLDEWKTLLGATDTGANLIIDLLQTKKINNLQGLLAAAKKRRYGKKTDVHHGSYGSIVNRITTFIHHEVFNIKQQKITEEKSINNGYLNLLKEWRKNIIPIICFYMTDERYMKIVVNNILNQQWLINRERDDDKRYNILNIFDDAQFYFNNDINNVAAQNASKTINLGRTNRFNGIYVVQNPNEFYPHIIEGCKDIFISDLEDPTILSKTFGKEVTEMAKSLEEKSEPSNFNYAWLHKPQARRYSKIFYPLLSPVYHHYGG